MLPVKTAVKLTENFQQCNVIVCLVLTSPTYLKIDRETASTLYLTWSEPNVGGSAQRIEEYNVKWNAGNENTEGNKTVKTAFTAIERLSSNTKYSIVVAVRGTNGQPDGEASDTLYGITRKSYVSR